MKIDNSPARGMRDLLPADVAVRDHVLESISAVYRRFGYQRIETPALEDIARLQRGRYRQFYQCDIDMIGEPTVLAEAELIEATSEALGAVGLTGTTIRLSDRRFLAALAADCGVPLEARDAFFVTLDKLDKIG